MPSFFYNPPFRRLSHVLILLGFVLLGLGAQAQTGTIRGQVIDAEFNDVLIGATVLLEGTTLGANTDLDGQFTIANVPVGTYTLVFSYLGYTKYTITDVAVKAGEIAVVNVTMEAEGTSVDEVVITAKQLEISEASLLNVQFKSSNTLDGLGSRTISRIGDSDVGGAIRRVVGVTVEGGKYVYVRGLGDRYGKTMVNGAELPGLDPTRNSAQIDLFPTNVIDNLLIYKNFTPDLPGSFTGGLVDISTRDFPDQYTLNISVSASYNTQATFNSDWLTYDGSNLDFLGFGFKDRDVPSVARTNLPNLTSFAARQNNIGLTNEINNAFSSQWVPTTESAPLDHSISLSLGNQTKLFGKTFGYIVSASYRRQYTYYEGRRGVFRLIDQNGEALNTTQDLEEITGTNEVLWSLLGNFSMKFNDNNKLSLLLMRTQSGVSTATFLDGFLPENNTDDWQEIRILDYNQRSNTIAQLRGEHVLGDNAWNIDWVAAATYTENFQPDFRTWGIRYQLVNGVKQTNTYEIGNTTGDPVRFFRELEETNLDFRLHITRNFQSWTGTQGKFKFGGAWTNKIGRRFSENQYNYQGEGGHPLTGSRSIQNFIGNFDDYFASPNNNYSAPANLGDFAGFHYSFNTNFVNSYSASENIFAGYAMVDMPIAQKLKMVAGARLETTEIEVTPEETSGTNFADGKIEQSDILPALSFIYSPNDKSNIRLNYGATVARPVFREIAPFEQFDFFAGPRRVGNDSLDRSRINNVDVRYEYLPSPNEVFAISAYYKLIDQPIEVAQIPTAQRTTLTWQNVDEATVYGLELDFRKNFAFISEKLANVSLGLNASYTFSEVDVPAAELAQGRQLDPNMDDKRELFGQSPYVINASLVYTHPTNGSSYTVAFNRFGERLILVAEPGTPNYYEQPRNSLDINILQRVGGPDSRWMIRVGGSNLLNPSVRWTSTYRGVDYNWVDYKEGARITLGVNYSFTR